jgi:drug/metabolite transporter (DMT)-like permease
MVVAVLAVSTSGPLIAASAVPPLAIAFWRNALGTVALGPLVLTRHVDELRTMGRRYWWLAVASGVLLAGHFGTWVPSITMSSVASATALTCTQPVWAALIARSRGIRIPGRAWSGIVLALAGVLLLTGVDVSLSHRALLGDVLALVSGALAAGYMSVGSAVRRRVSTTAYTVVCYGCASLVLLAVCVATGQRLSGYPTASWIGLIAMTAGPQLLGHSIFNLVLRTTSATVVSLVLLFEVPGAALIAALWLGQHPPAAAIPAAALLLLGVSLVVVGDQRVDRPGSRLRRTRP